MNIVLIGKPGSGKGTACKQIADEFGHTVVVAGDLLRTERASGSKLGKRIQSIIDRGNLVPNDMINEIMEQEFKKESNNPNFLIDGYPRTVMQAISLDQMVKVDLVLYFDVADDIILKRIEERGKVSGRADDQDIEITKQRLSNYYTETYPAVEYYKKQNKLKTLDASKSAEDVYVDILDILGQVEKN
jgi:adenylate kinase